MTRPFNPLGYARYIWNSKKGGARKRGIAFHLSFEEWYNWYLSQGIDKNIPQKNEGKAWAMCRIGDTGAYELGNIYLATMRQNTKDAHNNGRIPKGNEHPCYHKGLKVKTPDGIFYVDDAAIYYKKTPQAIRWRVKHMEGYEYAS